MNQIKTKPETEDEKEQEVLVDSVEKDWFTWVTPERSFKKRDKDFWVTAIAILVLVAVILIFIKEFFLIVTLGAILFLAYVLSTVPPEPISAKLTNRAVYFGEMKYPWDILENFWFKKSLDSETINFGTWLRFPRVVTIVVNPDDKEKLIKLVTKRIPMIKDSPHFVDKMTKWAAERLPLEDKDNPNNKI